MNFSQLKSERLIFLYWITFGHIMIHWYINLFSLILPNLESEFGLSAVELGFFTTTQMGIASSLMLVGGYLADTFLNRQNIILIIAIFILGISLFFIGTVQSYISTLISTTLIGVSIALWHPAAMGNLSLKFPSNRGMALSVHGTGGSIGDSLSPLIVGVLIMTFPWRSIMQFHLIPTIIFCILMWKNLSTKQILQTENIQLTKVKFDILTYIANIKEMLTNYQALSVMASNSLIQMSRLAVITFLPIYLSKTLEFSSSKLGLYISLLYLLGIVSQPIMGIVSDKFGRKIILIPSFIIIGLTSLLISLTQNDIFLAIIIGILGVFFYPILNLNQTAIMDVANKHIHASSMGITSLISWPAVLISPILAGLLVDTFNIEIAFIYAGIIALSAAFIILPVKFRILPLK